MEKYDYKRAITDDVKDWIVNDSDIIENGYTSDNEKIYDWIYDEVFDNDSITGNGYYYYNTEEKCSEYLSGNFDLLYPAMDEFGIDTEVRTLIKCYEDKTIARYFDCMIRCYLLMDCIYAAVDELIKDGSLKKLTNN